MDCWEEKRNVFGDEYKSNHVQFKEAGLSLFFSNWSIYFPMICVAMSG